MQPLSSTICQYVERISMSARPNGNYYHTATIVCAADPQTQATCLFFIGTLWDPKSWRSNIAVTP